MKRIGFIRDKNEIRYLVLYVMSFLRLPVKKDDLAEMALCDGGFGYFEFADALDAMTKDGSVQLDGNVYSLTEKGRAAKDALARALPESVREEGKRSAAHVGARVAREACIEAWHKKNDAGNVTVYLAFNDDQEPVFSFSLQVSDEAHALVFEKNFRAHAEKIYDGMLYVLLNDYEE